MMTLFDGIPDVFVEKYDAQFLEWARDFRTKGAKCAIVFDVLPGQVPALDVAGNLVWAGAWMTAQVETLRGKRVMVVRPATDWDRNLIETHCWNLRRWMS